MMSTDFNMQLQEYIDFTEMKLKEYNALTPETAAQKNLIEAMNYSLEAGGKRIRPVLVYAFCKALGGDYKKASAPACAALHKRSSYGAHRATNPDARGGHAASR